MSDQCLPTVRMHLEVDEDSEADDDADSRSGNNTNHGTGLPPVISSPDGLATRRRLQVWPSESRARVARTAFARKYFIGCTVPAEFNVVVE